MSFTQFFFHFPLPVCNRAVAPAKPDTKNKPWKGGGRYCYKMSPSCFQPDPAKNIKPDERKVSKREKYVKES